MFLSGLLFDYTGSYQYPFMFGGTLSVLAGLIMLIVYRNLHQQTLYGSKHQLVMLVT